MNIADLMVCCHFHHHNKMKKKNHRLEAPDFMNHWSREGNELRMMNENDSLYLSTDTAGTTLIGKEDVFFGQLD